MPYHLIFTDWFNRNLKQLGKRNPGLRSDFKAFLADFEPEAHPVIPGTGGARKARMKAKGKGKRGGYRLIYYLVAGNTVWLITVYDKVHKEDLSPSEKSRVIKLVQAIKEQSQNE